jgi:hypothetical protein
MKTPLPHRSAPVFSGMFAQMPSFTVTDALALW